MIRLVFIFSLVVLTFIGALLYWKKVQSEPLFPTKGSENSDEGISGLSFITLASILGFIGVWIIDIFTLPFIFSEEVSDGFLQTIVSFFLYFLFGFPFAVGLGYLFGYPIWGIASSLKTIDRKTATQIGIIFGAGAGGVNTLMFIGQAGIVALCLDWISTVFVGGLAGFWSFKILNRCKDLQESGKDHWLP